MYCIDGRHHPLHLRSHLSTADCHIEFKYASASTALGFTHRVRVRIGIVAHTLTAGNTDDAPIGLALIETVDADISCVTADGAYDTVAIYEAADVRGATVVVPPTITPAVSRRRPRSSLRDRTIRRVKQIGRRQWNKESGYHRQARVENAFFRYKSIIGDRLRARHPRAQATETAIACTILNRMTELGRPVSFAIGP